MKPDSVDAQAPWIDRFLRAHPELVDDVQALLNAASSVRSTRLGALAGDGFPPPLRCADQDHLLAALESATLGLEQATEQNQGTEISRAINDWLSAFLSLRAASHGFAPTRQTTSPVARTALFQAMSLFNKSWARLQQRANAAHVPRLPWRLAFSTHISPHHDFDDIELDGNDLPGLPISRLPWGERCFLTGESFQRDSVPSPVFRYRSLESCDTVLSPLAFEFVRSARASLSKIRESCPDEVSYITAALPELFEDYTSETCSQTFAALGLADFPSLAVTISNALVTFSERPFLSERRSAPALEWRSYSDIRNAALALARSFEKLGIPEGARVGVMASPNCADLYVVDFACVFAGLASVGLHDRLDDETIQTIVRQTETAVIVAGRHSLDRLSEAGVGDSVHLIIIEPGKNEEIGSPDPEGALRLEHLIQEGSRAGADWRSRSGIGLTTPVIYDDSRGWAQAEQFGITPDREDDLYTVIFTSGTTGRPKGYPVTRRRWREGMDYGSNLWPYVTVSYQPFALAADRKAVWQVALNGGRVGFAASGPQLFDEIRSVRPTYFEGPPAVWSVIVGEFRRALSEASGSLADRARTILRLRDFMGGRLAGIAIGGAPSDPALRHTLEEIFGIPMGEGYGTTETGTIAENRKLLAHLDYKILDVPELGLGRGDRPFPRGELAVRPKTGATRYLGDPDVSMDRFTEDGYFRTGDLIEMRSGGEFRVLGRTTEAMKAPGGEFIAPARLEEKYRNIDLVEQIFISPVRNGQYLVAVAVPSKAGVSAEEILIQIRRHAVANALRPDEIPLEVIVEPPSPDGVSPWTPENGLMTASWKMNRNALTAKYSSTIEQVAARAVADGEATSQRPSPDDSPESWLKCIVEIAAALLRLPSETIKPSQSFSELGGDSLNTAEFALRLEGLSLRPTGLKTTDLAMASLNDLADRFHVLASGSTPHPLTTDEQLPQSRQTASSSHTSVNVAEIVATDILRAPLIQTAADPAVGGNTVLTGATGFLGIHVLAELVASLPEESKVFAFVRAESHAEARARLLKRAADARLEIGGVAVPDETEPARIVAVAGSLDRSRLGIDEALWSMLAEEAAHIIHGGAAVHHEASYTSLRAANVDGTRRVLQLALTGRLKTFHLVSSLDVALLASRFADEPPTESVPLGNQPTEEVVSSSTGYAVSKWAAECMVRLACQHLGGRFRASVSRPSLVSWSSVTGYGNPSDWLSRFIDSCIELEMVPTEALAGVPSAPPITPTSARGLDLVPVDFVAQSVVRLTGLTATGSLPASHPGGAAGVPTFHVSNINPGADGLVTWRHLTEALVAAWTHERGSSNPLRPVPLDVWRLHVAASDSPFKPLLGTLGRLPELPRTAARNFRAAAETEGLPTLVCPRFDTDLMRRYLERSCPAAGDHV